MDIIITEGKLKKIIYRFLDEYIFKDADIIEDKDWVGVRSPKYEEDILGYEKRNPDALFYWGEVVDMSKGSKLFGLSYDTYKDIVSEYIRNKFGFKHKTLR